jgi:hypothetical protein
VFPLDEALRQRRNNSPTSEGNHPVPRFRSARWAAVLLTALALMTPAFAASGDTTDPTVVSGPAPDDMIWG